MEVPSPNTCALRCEALGMARDRVGSSEPRDGLSKHPSRDSCPGGAAGQLEGKDNWVQCRASGRGPCYQSHCRDGCNKLTSLQLESNSGFSHSLFLVESCCRASVISLETFFFPP